MTSHPVPVAVVLCDVSVAVCTKSDVPLLCLPYPTIVVHHVVLPHSQALVWEPGNEANTPSSNHIVYVLRTYIFL